MNLHSVRSAGAGVLVVAAVAGLAYGLRSSFEERPDANRPSKSQASVLSAGAGFEREVGPVALSKALADRIDRSDIELGLPSMPAGLRTYAEAVADAKTFTRGLGGSSTPSAAVLANVTVRNYGTEIVPDTKAPSQVVLAVRDRPAWVLVYEKVPAPVAAGAFTDDPKELAARDAFNARLTATVAVVVDARTGDFLNATTI